MRISDWSSDVCSSDLHCTSCSAFVAADLHDNFRAHARNQRDDHFQFARMQIALRQVAPDDRSNTNLRFLDCRQFQHSILLSVSIAVRVSGRSEEHTSELQSLMRISYAVFCLKKKNKK